MQHPIQLNIQFAHARTARELYFAYLRVTSQASHAGDLVTLEPLRHDGSLLSDSDHPEGFKELDAAGVDQLAIQWLTARVWQLKHPDGAEAPGETRRAGYAPRQGGDLLLEYWRDNLEECAADVTAIHLEDFRLVPVTLCIGDESSEIDPSDVEIENDDDDGEFEDRLAESRWIDAHSVNCLICHELVDERDCLLGPNGVGDICPKCQAKLGPAGVYNPYVMALAGEIDAAQAAKAWYFEVYDPAADDLARCVIFDTTLDSARESVESAPLYPDGGVIRVARAATLEEIDQYGDKDELEAMLSDPVVSSVAVERDVASASAFAPDVEPLYGTTYGGCLRLYHLGDGCYPMLFSTADLAEQEIKRIGRNPAARRLVQVKAVDRQKYAGQKILLDNALLQLDGAIERPPQKCAVCQGFCANQDDIARDANPFDLETEESIEWLSGWDRAQACKLSEEK